MWDELMDLVNDPTPDEPTATTWRDFYKEVSIQPESVRAGRLNDDGTYKQQGTRLSRDDDFKYDPDKFKIQMPTAEELELYQQQESARWTLQAMGFQIVDNNESIAETLGLVEPEIYQRPDGLWL